MKKTLALLFTMAFMLTASTLSAYAQIGEVEEDAEGGIIGEGERREEGAIGEDREVEEGVVGEEEREVEVERDLPGFEATFTLAGALAVAYLLRRG